MAKSPKTNPTEPPAAPAGKSYHIDNADIGPGAVFGDDRSTNKKIGGGDFIDASTSENSGPMLRLVVGVVLIVLSVVLSVVPIGLSTTAKFLVLVVMALGGALLTNGIAGTMNYKKGAVRAAGPYAVFMVILSVGAGILLHGNADQPPSKPTTVPTSNAS